jgi:capsular polysaccharide biosynthesis protein
MRAPKPTYAEGRVGALVARGDAAYYHFLTDVLPRLSLLEELEVPPERLYMPASLPFQQQLIEMLGIPADGIIDSDRVRHLQAELLVVPGLPDAHLRTPPWIVRFLRERLLPWPQSTPTRRIYLSRGHRPGNRIVANEQAVLETLTERGFELIDPGAMPVAEQIRMFATARTIVAPHGGALTNLAFASPGASVVELFAPDYVQGCYWKLSTCVPGLTYRYLVGDGKPDRGGRMLGVDSDMRIDVSALASLVDSLLLDSEEQVTASI